MITLDFGKHKGQKLDSIPDSYLTWLADKIGKQDVKQAALEEINRRKQPPKQEYNALIYGKNPTPKIVNISYLDSKIYIFTQDNKTPEIIDYKPWALSGSKANNFESTKLLGNQYYKYITELSDEAYERASLQYSKQIWTPRSIEEGFMLRNGYTYNKDLTTDDVSLLSFDIEATGLNPKDKKAKVLLISNTFRSNVGIIEKKLFDVKSYKTDTDMIADWVKYVVEIDPDIILGHNVFSYDLPYLLERSGDNLPLGRNSEPMLINKGNSKFRKDGSQQYIYRNIKIFGREIVDTLFLSIKYDIGRQIPSYGLKAIEKHLNLVDENRVEWDFKALPPSTYMDWPKADWDKFREYCKDDADSPIAIYDYMIPTFFYFAQVIPKTLQEIVNQATGSQLDSFMIRAYLQDGYSQPISTEKKEFQGAISFGIPGNYKNVFSVDFHALYPSIIKAYELYEKKKDPNAYFLEATKYFTNKRVEYKKLYQETNIAKYDGMQSAAKAAANSLYGFCGSGYLLYNAPDISARITEIGRELLNKICTVATSKDAIEWKNTIKQEKEANEDI